MHIFACEVEVDMLGNVPEARRLAGQQNRVCSNWFDPSRS
jgi:hypothetical protein